MTESPRMFLESRESASELAAQALQQKEEILLDLDIPADYEGFIREADGTVEFADPDKVERAIAGLSARIKETAQAYKNKASADLFVREFALVSALSELTIMGPKGISDSIRLKETNPDSSIGVQKEQIQSAITISRMHSDEVASGQGKSYLNIPIAAVVRHLLTDTQVHIMVKDTQSKLRDTENLQRLTSRLEIATETIDGGEETLRENERMKGLILTKFVLEHDTALSPQVRQEKIEAIEDEIESTSISKTFAQTLEKIVPQKVDAPGIVIGTDYDFVFDSLKGKTERYWQPSVAVIADEGDLFWERENRYVLTGSNVNVLESYVRDYIASSIANGVATLMIEEKLITKNEKGLYEFYDIQGTDTDNIFNDLFKKWLLDIKESGSIHGEDLQVLMESLSDATREVCQDFDILLDINEDLARSLVRAYTPDPDTYAAVLRNPAMHTEVLDTKEYDPWVDAAGQFQTAWLTAERLTLGSDYGSGSKITYVIDPLTGERLLGHQFSGQTDVAIDIRSHACTLRPRGTVDENSTGFLSFALSAYGRGNISLVSGTLSHIANEIKEFTGSALEITPRWIGEDISIPSFNLTQTREDALSKRIDPQIVEFLKNGRPIQYICENDEELKFLHSYIQEKLHAGKNTSDIFCALVTSDTPEEEAKAIYEKAGQAWAITLTNPKGSRAISVPTSLETEKLGGLLVHLWGPQTSNAVLRQALARTRRAGNQGDFAWTIYKTGGFIGLENLSVAREHAQIREDVEQLRSGIYEYSGSTIETIHTQRIEDFARGRLSTLGADYLRRELARALLSEAKEIVTKPDTRKFTDRLAQILHRMADPDRSLATDEYIRSFIVEHFGSILTDTASQLGHSVSLQDVTYDKLIEALSRIKIEQREAQKTLIQEAQSILLATQAELQTVHDMFTKLRSAQQVDNPFVFSIHSYTITEIATLQSLSGTGRTPPPAISSQKMSFRLKSAPRHMFSLVESKFTATAQGDPEQKKSRHIMTFTAYRFNDQGQVESAVPLMMSTDTSPDRKNGKEKYEQRVAQFYAFIYDLAIQLHAYEEAVQAVPYSSKNNHPKAGSLTPPTNPGG